MAVPAAEKLAGEEIGVCGLSLFFHIKSDDTIKAGLCVTTVAQYHIHFIKRNWRSRVFQHRGNSNAAQCGRRGGSHCHWRRLRRNTNIGMFGHFGGNILAGRLDCLSFGLRSIGYRFRFVYRIPNLGICFRYESRVIRSRPQFIISHLFCGERAVVC